MSKKKVFLVSAVYTLYSVGVLIWSSLCSVSSCRIREDELLGMMLVNLLVLLPVFFLSLITYKMREEVFQAWWRVAVWFVPIIIVATYLMNSSHQQSGFGGVAQDSFYFVILIALYGIFIITSLSRIILAHRRLKRENV